MGENLLGMNLATVVIYDNMTFQPDKWEKINSVHTSTVEKGKEIQIGCRIFNASDIKDPPPSTQITQITVKKTYNERMGPRIGQEQCVTREFQKVIWDNATEFEKRFQSWWHLVNFTFDPLSNTATAFVLTIY